MSTANLNDSGAFSKGGVGLKIDGMEGWSFLQREINIEEALSVSTFARAIDSPIREFVSTEVARSEGYAGRPLHPGMLGVVNTVEPAELLDVLAIDEEQLAMATTEIEFFHTATEQEVLIGETCVSKAMKQVGIDARARQFVVLETTFRTQKGNDVSRIRTKFIELLEHYGPTGPSSTGISLSNYLHFLPNSIIGQEERQNVVCDPFIAHKGDELPARCLGPLTRVGFARVAIAVNDTADIHVEDDVARAAGFPYVIAPGALLRGLLTDAVAAWAGIEALRSATVRVVTPVCPGATLRVRGKVVDRSDQRITVALRANDQRGVVIGEGTFGLTLWATDERSCYYGASDGRSEGVTRRLSE